MRFRTRPALGSWLRWSAALTWIALVALITFTPGATSGAWAEGMHRTCIICGERGTGDAVLNVVFFLPLGLLLGRLWSPGRVALAGLLVSGVIEGTQAFVPGRFSGLADLVWNTVGAGLGAWTAAYVAQVLNVRASRSRPPVPSSAMLGGLLPLAYLAVAGSLFHPVGTDAPYVGMVNPELGQFVVYQGEVHDATLNGEPLRLLPYTPVTDPRLEPGGAWRLGLTLTKGPPPGRIAALATVYDMEGREIFVLGALGEDLVWRERTRARSARLDRPLVRWRGALRDVHAGERVALEVQGEGRRRCFVVGSVSRCDVGLTPGETWSFLMARDGASPALSALLRVGWMATLFFPLGLVAGSAARVSVAGGATGMGVVLVSALTPLVFPPWWEWAGALLGVLAGVLSRPLARAFLS